MEDFVITIPIPKGIADIKLPDPDLVSYYENLKNRIIIVDYEIDETLLNTIGSQILEYNRQDKGIPVEQRKKDCNSYQQRGWRSCFNACNNSDN